MESFLTSLGCETWTPTSAGWDKVMTHWNLDALEYVKNGSRRPAAIVRPTTEQQICKVVKYCSETKTPITARSGGHGFFTYMQGCICVDMRSFVDVKVHDVNGEEALVTAGMGNTLGTLMEKSAPYHIPVGTVSHTGMGLFFTGGIGYQCKKRGLTSDNIVSFRIVTADGEVKECDKDNHPDLFWAASGAGPNIGIITSVTAKAYKHETALVNFFAFPISAEKTHDLMVWCDSDEVLNDNDMMQSIVVCPTPDRSLMVTACFLVYTGKDDAKVERLLKTVKGYEEAIQIIPISRMPFTAVHTVFDGELTPMKRKWYSTWMNGDFNKNKGQFTPSMEFCEGIVKTIQNGPLSADTFPLAIIESRGGPESGFVKKGPAATTMTQRARWEVIPLVGWEKNEDDARMIRIGKDLKEISLKHDFVEGTRAVPLSEDNPKDMQSYYGSNTERLEKILSKYDPTHLFKKCNGVNRTEQVAASASG